MPSHRIVITASSHDQRTTKSAVHLHVAGFLGYHLITRVAAAAAHAADERRRTQSRPSRWSARSSSLAADYSNIRFGCVCTLLGFLRRHVLGHQRGRRFLITDRMLAHVPPIG
jgi:hypothetical protein